MGLGLLSVGHRDPFLKKLCGAGACLSGPGARRRRPRRRGGGRRRCRPLSRPRSRTAARRRGRAALPAPSLTPHRSGRRSPQFPSGRARRSGCGPRPSPSRSPSGPGSRSGPSRPHPSARRREPCPRRPRVPCAWRGPARSSTACSTPGSRRCRRPRQGGPCRRWMPDPRPSSGLPPWSGHQPRPRVLP